MEDKAKKSRLSDDLIQAFQSMQGQAKYLTIGEALEVEKQIFEDMKADIKASRIAAAKREVSFYQEELAEFQDDIWQAIYPNGNTAGDWEYPGQIIREVKALRELAMSLGWDGVSVIDPKLAAGGRDE